MSLSAVGRAGLGVARGEELQWPVGQGSHVGEAREGSMLGAGPLVEETRGTVRLVGGNERCAAVGFCWYSWAARSIGKRERGDCVREEEERKGKINPNTYWAFYTRVHFAKLKK